MDEHEQLEARIATLEKRLEKVEKQAREPHDAWKPRLRALEDEIRAGSPREAHFYQNGNFSTGSQNLALTVLTLYVVPIFLQKTIRARGVICVGRGCDVVSSSFCVALYRILAAKNIDRNFLDLQAGLDTPTIFAFGGDASSTVNVRVFGAMTAGRFTLQRVATGPVMTLPAIVPPNIIYGRYLWDFGRDITLDPKRGFYALGFVLNGGTQGGGSTVFPTYLSAGATDSTLFAFEGPTIVSPGGITLSPQNMPDSVTIIQQPRNTRPGPSFQILSAEALRLNAQ